MEGKTASVGVEMRCGGYRRGSRKTKPLEDDFWDRRNNALRGAHWWGPEELERMLQAVGSELVG